MLAENTHGTEETVETGKGIIVKAALLPFCAKSGETTAEQSYYLQGDKLQGYIEIASPNWLELCAENSEQWSFQLKLPADFKGNIRVRSLVKLVGEYFGELRHSSPGVSAKILKVSAAIGDGTPESPFPVGTPEQLYRVRDELKACYRQYCDIDLSGYGKSFNGGKGWKLIGTFAKPFQGRFEGMGFRITGLYVNNYALAATFAGLFGSLAEAEVSGVIISGAYLHAFNVAALSAGFIWRSAIRNCRVENTEIRGNSLCAGLVSQMEEGTIEDCSTDTQATMYSCGFGGIFSIAERVKINRCMAIVNTKAFKEEPLNGVWQADSFCGFGVVAMSSEIADSYAIGSCRGSMWLGGFVQTLDLSPASFTPCLLTNCYCAVKLTSFAYPPYPNEVYGGFLVELGEGAGEVNSCYFDVEVAGTGDTAAGNPLKTAEAKQRKSYIGWDFSYTWQIAEGKSYPTLKQV